jgi:hypothetical protein
MIPNSKPPIMAPGILPIPPNIVAVLKSGCPYDPHYLKLKSNLEVVLT